MDTETEETKAAFDPLELGWVLSGIPWELNNRDGRLALMKFALILRELGKLKPKAWKMKIEPLAKRELPVALEMLEYSTLGQYSRLYGPEERMGAKHSRDRPETTREWADRNTARLQAQEEKNGLKTQG